MSSVCALPKAWVLLGTSRAILAAYRGQRIGFRKEPWDAVQSVKSTRRSQHPGPGLSSRLSVGRLGPVWMCTCGISQMLLKTDDPPFGVCFGGRGGGDSRGLELGTESSEVRDPAGQGAIALSLIFHSLGLCISFPPSHSSTCPLSTHSSTHPSTHPWVHLYPSVPPYH